MQKNGNGSASSNLLPSIQKRATPSQQGFPPYECRSKRLSYASLPCLPIQVTVKVGNTNERRCVDDENSDSQIYNQKLAKLLPKIQSLLPGSKFVYADVYEPLIDMINNPQKFGFVETKRGCCDTGLVEAAYQYLSKYLEKNVLPKLAYRNQSQPLITRSDHPYRADDRYW